MAVTVTDLRTALTPLDQALGADDYRMDLAVDPVTITIVPGPNACADCLVPEPVMRQVIDDALRAHDIRCTWELRI